MFAPLESLVILAARILHFLQLNCISRSVFCFVGVMVYAGCSVLVCHILPKVDPHVADLAPASCNL